MVAESTDLTDNVTPEAGTYADTVDGESFPAGITIYGRWTAVALASGAVMLYMSS